MDLTFERIDPKAKLNSAMQIRYDGSGSPVRRSIVGDPGSFVSMKKIRDDERMSPLKKKDKTIYEKNLWKN